jgi:RNA polymerase sigma-70 factor (ECF subfamily)
MLETALLRPTVLPRTMRSVTRAMESLIKQTDAQLVTLTLKGNRDAYGELVRRYQTAAYNVARRIVGDSQDALDVTQDAFVRAYDALASFDRARPFAPWLNTIVANLALNFAQRRRPADRLEAETDAHDASENPEQRALVAERQEQVRAALLRLPPMWRAAVELRHFQGLSYEEIATALNVPVSDVKSYLYRARQKLKEIFEQSE